ncbi:hypothetical protein [Legionella gresilensis]|uniref:hypothetical protein n=1 Tax=Legionella gresilensis TaxID=91823 RepID=UPI001F5E4313|nr:hypothetical protein [Legionella gresilensis]
MKEIDEKIDSSLGLKPNKRKLINSKKNNKIKNKSGVNQAGILNKLSKGLALGKAKVSALVREVSMAERKQNFKRIRVPDAGRLEVPGRFSDGQTGKRKSILRDDTPDMARKRRLLEQDGHRYLAKVHAREHNSEEDKPAPEGELQNSIKQHPWLDAQRFDGVDPNLNPEPPLNTAARREFDNERREQEMEKQLRLGNMPKFSTAPKPEFK